MDAPPVGPLYIHCVGHGKPIVRLVALVPVLAVLIAAFAASAEARAPRSFFGIQAWATPSKPEFRTIASARLGTYRFTMLWSVVEFQKGARNWGPMDEEVRGAAQNGMTPLPVLLGSPRFAAPRYQYPPRSASALGSYSAFVRDAAARYGRNGSFWKENPNVPYRPISSWQVWNEPNFPAYWYGRPNARQYVSLVKRTRSALRSADRKAKVMLAGLPTSRNRGAVSAPRFLRSIYRVRGASRAFDAVAVHPYAGKATGVLRFVAGVRKVMNRAKDRRTSIHVTELGWGTGGMRTRNQRALVVSRRGQAARIKSSLRTLIRNRRRYRIGSAIVFCLRDRLPGATESNYWALHAGLFTRGGKAKPAWRTYKSIVRRRR